MGALEIFLLIAGTVIFVGSFLLPQSTKEAANSTKKLAKEEIKALVSQEMDGVKSHIDDVVDEAVGYAMEKTERSLERLSNEKIMAVNEYSDTVLQEIHKNHEEVMFLYDMLNNKHVNLKNAVSEVNKTVKEAEETKKVVEETRKEAEAVVSSFHKFTPEMFAMPEGNGENSEQENKLEVLPDEQSTEAVSVQDDMDISSMQDSEGQAQNSNEQILALHKQGKTNVTIAKELGLGVGEVKLVIDLYKNKWALGEDS